MIVWWNGISLRERAIVAVAAAFLLYVLIDLIVIQPAFNSGNQLQQQVEQAREDLDWMIEVIPRISGTSSSKQPISGSIVSFVDTQVSRLDLKRNLQQMTPLQDGQVRVRLNEVKFEKLLQFFATLDRSVAIEEVRILPQAESGVVNASAILRLPGVS
jgi:type II secretory pathway component PulM